MLTKHDILTAIHELVESAKAAGIPLEHVLLFGSYAKGTPHTYSDVDIALFSPKFTENPIENIRLIQPLKRIPQMQLHLYQVADFEEDSFVVEEVRQYALEIGLAA